jgi:hypothetical protein
MSGSDRDGLEARILELLWAQRERAEDTEDKVSDAGLTIAEITRDLNLGQTESNRVGREQVAPLVGELLARGTIGEDQATPGHWIHRGSEA